MIKLEVTGYFLARKLRVLFQLIFRNLQLDYTILSAQEELAKA